MRGEAMKRVLGKLNENPSLALDKMTGLEFFAREGDWQTVYFSDAIKDIYAWEIDNQFEDMLNKNLPNAKITIGNSYELISKCSEMFDFVVLDNPQGNYGMDNEFTEHFKALPLILNALKKDTSCIVMFNINSKPFNYDDNPEWKKRREDYYGVQNTDNLDLDFLKNFYKNLFENLGCTVENSFIESRNPEYLHYMVLQIRR